MILHTNIDQTLMNALHGLLNCEIGGLNSHVMTTEYRSVSIVYACVFLVMHWSTREYLFNVLIQYYIAIFRV